MPQKISKKLPKRTTNAHKKDYRAAAYRNGKARKDQRRADQEARARANASLTPDELRIKVNAEKRIAPSVLRNRKPKRDNMIVCNRCKRRQIVAGSVCWCRTLPGEGN